MACADYCAKNKLRRHSGESRKTRSAAPKKVRELGLYFERPANVRTPAACVISCGRNRNRSSIHYSMDFSIALISNLVLSTLLGLLAARFSRSLLRRITHEQGGF